MWSGFARTWKWALSIWYFMRRGPSRRAFCICTRSRFCRACVRRLVEMQLVALRDFPLVERGDDLAAVTVAALARDELQLRPDDVLVFAQKIISKSEGRQIDLASVTPSAQALELAHTVRKDPRLVELILRESRRVVR